MHRHLPGQFQVVYPAFQIIARRPDIAQFLREDHLVIGVGGGDRRGPGGDDVGVQLFDFLLTGGDIQTELAVKI